MIRSEVPLNFLSLTFHRLEWEGILSIEGNPVRLTNMTTM